MTFLPVVGFWIANEPVLDKEIPEFIENSTELTPDSSFFTDSDSNSSIQDKFLFEDIEIKPFVLEGTVENFDPVSRAMQLTENLSRKWCGEFTSFKDDVIEKVELNFNQITSSGHMVEMNGQMSISNMVIPVYGNLNAKSDQVELLPNLNNSIAGLEPGGVFIGLQGLKKIGWRSSRLDHPGGVLELNTNCSNEISKSPSIRTVW